MSVTDWLQGIRPAGGSRFTLQHKLLRLLSALALGAAMGLVAKWADGVPVLGEIATRPGAWVLAATILAAWSRSPRAAALHVLAFFLAMLAAYYAYSMVLFSFFARYYFVAWGGLALLSPIAAYVVWYARGRGWLAALCAAAPVALLLAEGYAFLYTRSMPLGFALLAALVLFVALPADKRQWLRTTPLVAILFLLITQLHLQSLLFGGL
ncbi:MAG TPA: DUF6518 family protein [Anaerolineae bacterium]|nr:DUF6518 family protein [Anaerolineae bacterium]HOQ97354.1 DUF6518 family protein [Anaerolineae bacterium]